MRIILSILITFLLVLPATAENRYSSWEDPDATKPTPVQADNNARLDQLIKELNVLIKDATNARAANPLFLQDLKKLAKKYRQRRSRRVISDTFEDRDFTQSPVWTVSSGEYRIEQGWGLRNIFSAANTQQQSQQNSAPKDPAAALLGALLQSALGGKTQGGSNSAKPAAKPQAAAIYTSAQIGNAFDVTVHFSSWSNRGQFSLGPYQDARQQTGYRVAYTPGEKLELLRVSRRGSSVIQRSARAVSLEDKKIHKLRWVRRTNGSMKIRLDGELLIDSQNQSFRDPFQGLVIRNDGSDVIVKSVTVDVLG